MNVEKAVRTEAHGAEKTIGEFVAEDYRTAAVFEKYGIDFCCGGKVILSAVCREKGIDLDEILREIVAAGITPLGRSQDYAAWDLSFLSDYIVNVHHAYLWENLPQIAASTRKVAQVHGDNHPEVMEIAAIFDRIAADMDAHLREEEEVLFPTIKIVESVGKTGSLADSKDLDTIRVSLERLIREHEEVGEAVHAIRRLSKDYALPSDACNTFMVTYRKLGEFEDDLHKHVHLENNILFPKAQQCKGIELCDRQ
ncbi:MAG: iron-sulfur cluster repair di-iron protein [Geobacteraceae bacterium]|nr:iron-sulfur cluster repair di-iron protein [Geobacteraceae bacterium]